MKKLGRYAMASLAGLLVHATVTRAATHDAGTVDQLQEVVVTAERRSENLQKTPIAVDVVSGQEVQQMGRTRLDDVLQNVAGVVVQAAARGQMVAIRGLGDDLPPQNGQTSVSMNFDGLYNFRAESGSIGFYDLDHVEVLSGPQNTLYGRSASGGVVNVNSREPVIGNMTGYGTVELGNYGLMHTEGAVSLPIGDSVAWRTAFTAINRQGFLSNGHDDDVGQAVRSKLLFKPSEDVSIEAAAEYTRVGGKGPGAIPAANFSNDPRATTDTDVGSQNYHSWKYWLVANVAIGPGVLLLEPSYQRGSGEVLGSFGGNFTHSWDPRLATQSSAEVRYQSAPGATVQWDLGYYHYNNEDVQQSISGACQDPSGQVYVPPPGESDSPAAGSPAGSPCVTPPYAINRVPTDLKTSTNAAFGQVTYPLLDRLRLIGGLRYTRDYMSSQEADPTAASSVLDPAIVFSSARDTHVDWRAGIEYDVASASMLYATASSGYRAGGFNFNNTAFGPEKLEAYEIGSKNRFLGNRLQINGDLYYYDYHDYQLATPGFDNFGNVTVLFVNLPTAWDWGAEFEPQMLLTPDDTVSGGVEYLDTRLTSSLTSLLADYDGAPFPHAPKVTVKAGYSHVFHIRNDATLTARIDARYLGSQFTAPVDAASANATAEAYMGGYSTGDISVLYSAPAGKWTVNAYMKNVNDKSIKSGDFRGYVTLQPPRTYGVVINAQF